MATDREHWSRAADGWVAWARKPNFDAFWAYRQALGQFIGPGDGEALDVGCGEGRVSRELTALGYRVTATDAVAAMVQAATEAGSAHAYAVAQAGSLPFTDASFDLVVAYNMLMDVDDLGAAVAETRRVMRPAARLIVSIVHPFTDRGRFAGDGAPFVIEGGYLATQPFEEVVERDGMRVHFSGWSRPLQDYVTALTDAGLAITALREPAADTGDGRDRLEPWTRLPMFVWLECRAV